MKMKRAIRMSKSCTVRTRFFFLYFSVLEKVPFMLDGF